MQPLPARVHAAENQTPSRQDEPAARSATRTKETHSRNGRSPLPTPSLDPTGEGAGESTETTDDELTPVQRELARAGTGF
jgi:hypothetical protein